MSMIPASSYSSTDGASTDVWRPEPSINLAPLMRYLTDAVPIPPEESAPKFPAAKLPFLDWDSKSGVLHVNTNAVLTRLRLNGEAKSALHGFLVDVESPKAAARAHLGGVITPKSEGLLSEHTKRLIDLIDAEIEALVNLGFDPAMLCTTPSAKVLDELQRKIWRATKSGLDGKTRISRARIGTIESGQAGRQDEIARLMDAVEEIDGDRATHIRNFLQSVEYRLKAEDHSPRRVSAAIQHHSHAAETTGSQLYRFFDFLENEALARVRMQVGTHIMQAIGAEAEGKRRTTTSRDWALLAAYCERATGLLGLLAAADTPALHVNLSAAFGQQDASFNMRDQAINALFVNCLPVWPEWRTQMFEDESPATSLASGPTLIRELSYHFRVNGTVPDTKMSSYLTRLDRIDKDWLHLTPDPEYPDLRPSRVNKSLAEIVFLWAAIPENAATPADPADALAKARSVAARMEAGGIDAVRQVLNELRARAGTVQRVTTLLITLLREKGTALTRSLSARRWDYYVNVLADIVNMQRICGEVEDPLTADTRTGDERVAFLRQVWISRDQSLPDALLSIRVQVRLKERSVSTVGSPEVFQVKRCLPDSLVQVVWRPTTLGRQPESRETSWLVSPRVEIVYDTWNVGWPAKVAHEPKGLRGLVAARSAQAILAHLTLLRLTQRAEALTGKRPALSVLRLQKQGRGAEPLSGDEGVYAAAQAVEIVLARDTGIRMQGIAFDSSADKERFKGAGVYTALLAGFPIQISQPHGERPMVGVVTYASRPANDHPDLPEGNGATLVLSRTYLATPIEAPFTGYQVGTVSSRTELVEQPVSLPGSVRSEIEELYDRGCRHVILIDHQFGQRRVGSGAAHPRLRDQGETLVQLAQSHPDLTLYPLVRDLFDATRLRMREEEDAFEILRASDHLLGAGQLAPDERTLRRRYEPVYSIATLHVVGGQAVGSEKPQSGFCTYFLLRDTGMAPPEVRVRLESNLLGDASRVRPSLLAALRSLHYLEAEKAASGKSKGEVLETFIQPVLDPYDWMTPDTLGKVGEVQALPPSRRRYGSAYVSLVAILDRTSRIAHSRPVPGALSAGENAGKKQEGAR